MRKSILQVDVYPKMINRLYYFTKIFLRGRKQPDKLIQIKSAGETGYALICLKKESL
jgi:hypothetical protein